MDKDELFKYLKENLSLNIKTESHLAGTGPYEWRDSHTIQLLLEGEVISEEYIS